MARLPQGMRKRNNGTLEKRITIQGKRISVYGSNVKEVLDKEQAIRLKIDKGIYTDNHNIKLDEYFEEWIKGKKASISGNTVLTYTTYYKKQISPELGNRKIQQIERREIIHFQSKLLDRMAIRSVNNCMRVLKCILNDAVNDEIIIKNPCSGVKAIKEKVKATESYHRALSKEEQQLFMTEMEKDYYYEFVAFMMCSGVRCGELGALTWADIDYRNDIIHINKTLTSTENAQLIVGETTKTGAGKRDIPLTETLKSILSRWKNKQEKVFSIHGSVFYSVEGDYVRSGGVNRAIASALERLENQGHHIEHFTSHALRDTYATEFIKQGGNMQTLKVLLGHTSLAMTMDLYSHVMPDTKQKEAESIAFNIAL